VAKVMPRVFPLLCVLNHKSMNTIKQDRWIWSKRVFTKCGKTWWVLFRKQ